MERAACASLPKRDHRAERHVGGVRNAKTSREAAFWNVQQWNFKPVAPFRNVQKRDCKTFDSFLDIQKWGFQPIAPFLDIQKRTDQPCLALWNLQK